MAAVWLVRDLELDEEMVAKIVPPDTSEDLVALLRRECRQARRLVHPNIPRVFDFHRGDSGHHFINMAHVDGEDIGRFRGGDPKEILSLAIPIADALAYSHRMGIVHRDLKVSNVILDPDQQPQLIDFGIAGMLGEGVSTEPAESPGLTAEPESGEEVLSRGGGSRYNVGPQQLAGREPQPDDDVYAFGVLLYELISGHPPFWPEITPRNIQSEAPAPMQSVHPVSPRLQEFVISMLEKFPAQRPASMEAVKAELEAIGEEMIGAADADGGGSGGPERNIGPEGNFGAEDGAEIEEETTSPAVALSPPPRVQTIQPIPPRADVGAPPTPNAVVSAEGVAARPKRWSRTNVAIFAILGLIAIQVFILLPGWLSRSESGVAPEATGAPPTAVLDARSIDARPQKEGEAAVIVATDPPFSAQELRDRAYLEQQAGEALDKAKGLLHSLEAAGVSIWGAEEHALAIAHLTTGGEGVKSGDYAAAATQYREASRLLERLRMRAPSVLQQALADGRQALAAGEATSAGAAFHLALQLGPDNQIAIRGLRSAQNLKEVQALMAAGAQAEQDGDHREAERSYKAAAVLDPDSRPAREALARVRARSREDAFAGFMTDGLAALGRAEYTAARQALARAGKIRPDSPQVADAVARVVEAENSDNIATRQGWAVRLEELERWRYAAAQFDTVLQVDPTLVFAREGKSRALERAELAESISYHLRHPGRLSANAVFEEVTELAQEAAMVEPAGARHRQQLEQLAKLLEIMGESVLVILESDGQTEVAVYQVGRLGTFVRHELELRPGTYTVVGQLKGYRDVRLQLVVKPGQQPPPLPVRCEEKI